VVVVRFPESGQYKRAYSIYLRLGISRCLQPSLLGWIGLPCYGSGPISVFPEPIPFCGEEIDEILDRDLSVPGSHGRSLKGFVSGDSRARTSPRGLKYSDRH
jgi:hypothetical protein